MKLCKNQDKPISQFVLPLKIVLEKDAENAEILLKEHARQAFLGNLPSCKIKKHGYVVLDFGEEFCGGADLVFQHIENACEGYTGKVRVVFGESVAEAMSEIGVHNATNDHSPRDIVINTGFYSHQQIGNTGYRFIKVQPLDGDVNIASLQGISKIRPMEYKGSFTCSDDLLNKIWKVGAKTVHLNMQEYLWDGIKRDRLVWIGDCHPETSTASMVFGETEVVKNSLDFVRDATPMPNWMNGLPSYSMWWVKIHRDFYFDSGNYEYLSEQKDYIVDLMNHVLSTIDGSKTSIKRFFVDHSSIDTPDDEPGLYAMLIIGLESGAEILSILDCEKELVAKCKEAANNLRKNSFPNIKNKNTSALTALAGIEDLNRICSKVIEPNDAHGISAFLGYYALISLYKNGKTKKALDYIRDFWGGMIKMGATTFWEEFDLDWMKGTSGVDVPEKDGIPCIHVPFGKSCYVGLRLSLCHGWASGPTSFLSRYVLGVKPVEAGYKKIKIEPNLGDLEFACGDIPTPYGNIHVFHKNVNGKIETQYELPYGVEIIKNL